jgi:hypothetical protein
VDKSGTAGQITDENIIRRMTFAFRIPKVTLTLPDSLYGCETWSITLREERRLRVFENRVLTRIFGPKRDEVTRGCEENFVMRSSSICAAHPLLCG